MGRTFRILAAALAALAAGAAASAKEDAAPAPPQVTWAPEASSVVVPSRNIDGDAWEAYKKYDFKPSLDQHLTDPILNGAIDLHAHFGPDTYPRQWDGFEIARLAAERGMRGAVFKNHWSESASLAYLVRKYAGVPGFEAFGGLVLNVPEGGINPQAVRYFAEVEGHFGRVVWFPTHDSEHEVKYLQEVRPYVIVSRDGVLLSQVFEVLDLIKHYDLTLATGHVSTEEMLQIVAEAHKRGIKKIVITHPDMGPQYSTPTVEQLKQAAALGGFVEIVTSELTGKSAGKFMDIIRQVGPEHCIVGTDSGRTGTPNHPDAMVLAIRALRDAGFSEGDLTLMFKSNPAFLVGLPVQ